MATKKKTTESDVMAMLAQMLNQLGVDGASLDINQTSGIELVPIDLVELPLDFDFDPSLPDVPPGGGKHPVTGCTSGSKKISIRIPNRILGRFNAKAKLSGTQYQTLITRTLDLASADWAK